jgi:hypothetical protein
MSSSATIGAATHSHVHTIDWPTNCLQCGSPITQPSSATPKTYRKYCNTLCRTRAYNRRVIDQSVSDALATAAARIQELEEQLANCNCGRSQHAK